MNLTDAKDIINYIGSAKKTTPVEVKLRLSKDVSINNENVKYFGTKDFLVLKGDLEDVEVVLNDIKDYILESDLTYDRRNSAIPLVDVTKFNARIEPGVFIRDHVTIEDNAVIMMGAVINIGAHIGEKTMIDMGVVLGGRAYVGKNCHVGAGTVLAGVIEPPSAQPVVVEDNVVIGANAVVLEGVRIGKGAVVAAGSIVTKDVEAGTVVAGTPARFIKNVDDKTLNKTEILDELRNI